MLTLLFIILMIVVFAKMLKLSISAAWGITKVLVTFVIFPIALIALVIWGLVYIAIPILVVVGIVALVKAHS